MYIDPHIHTLHNSKCSYLSIEEAVMEGKKIGLHGLCITDHEGDPPLREAEKLTRKEGILVLAGMEILTFEGDFLVFGLRRRPLKMLHVKELLRIITHEGGLAIGAHPYRNNGRSGGDYLKTLKDLSAIEGYNGNTLPKNNQKAHLLSLEMSRPCMGGSDAHRINEIGRFASYFPDIIRDVHDFIVAIKRERTYPVSLKNGSFSKIHPKGIHLKPFVQKTH